MADTGWTPVDSASTDSTGSDSASGSGWTPVSSGTSDGTARGFVSTYGDTINSIANRLKVDPSIIAGQLALETGNGKHVIPGTNNLGNIKDPSGKGPTAKDNQTGSTDAYQSYDSHAAFGDAYSDLIERKYPDAVGAKDATSFATALKKGGYAQDPNYVSKVTKSAGMMSNILAAISGSSSANASEVPQQKASSKGTSDVDSFLKQYGNPDLAKAANAPQKPAATDDSDDVSSFLKQYGPNAEPADKAPGTVTTTTNPVMMGARDAIYSKLDSAMGWLAKGANWVAPDSQFAKDAAQGVKDLHATNDAQQKAYDSVDHSIGGKVARFGTDLGGSIAMTPMTGGGFGSTVAQTAAQGFLADPDHPLQGTAIGGAGGAVGHVAGMALKPIVKVVTGTSGKLAAADAQAAQAGLATGEAFSPAERGMAGKITDNINTNGGKATDVADELAANSKSNVPGYQRTAAEATENPTIQAVQQGLDKSENNAGLAARAQANADANTGFLRTGATTDENLQGIKNAFQQGQDSLAAQGNKEVGAVTAAQDRSVFDTPAMQKNLGRANVMAKNEGDDVIQRAFDEPNNDLVAGWNGVAGNDARTAALEGERHLVTAPMYEGVLSNAKPMRVEGALHDLLETPIMQKALDAVSVNKRNALNDEPVIKDILTGTKQGYRAISPTDLNMAKMYLDNYMQRMGNPSDLASADRWQLANYANIRSRLNGMLESNVKGFADVNKEFAKRSDQIAESKFLTDPNMTNAFGKLNVGKLDALVKAIRAGKANNNPLDPAKSVSSAKLAQLEKLRDDAVSAAKRNSAEGLHGDAYNHMRAAAEKDPVAAAQLQAHLEANSPSYKQFYSEQAAGNHSIGQQENYNNLMKKFDTRPDGNVNWTDVRNLGTEAANYSPENVARLHAVQDNLRRYATRTEKVAGSNTASNFAKREGFDALVSAERGKGVGNYLMGEDGQRLVRTGVGSIASGLGFAHMGPVGALAADYVADKLATGASKVAGRMLGGQTDAHLLAATAANRDAVEKLLLNPKRLSDAMKALDKAGADKKAINESLLSKMDKTKATGGLLGAIIASQLAQKQNEDKRK